MMGQGITAYRTFVRIHEEMEAKLPPDWESLPHVSRMAWEAAAQAVAADFLPDIFHSDLFEDEGDQVEPDAEVTESVIEDAEERLEDLE